MGWKVKVVTKNKTALVQQRGSGETAPKIDVVPCFLVACSCLPVALLCFHVLLRQYIHENRHWPVGLVIRYCVIDEKSYCLQPTALCLTSHGHRKR